MTPIDDLVGRVFWFHGHRVRVVTMAGRQVCVQDVIGARVWLPLNRFRSWIWHGMLEPGA